MHLIITEKHDAAKRIASILFDRKPKRRRVSGVDTYEVDGKVVMGLSGHVVGVDFPKDYNNWQKIDLGELIYAEIITTATHTNIVAALRKLGREADHVTIATDYDREGELIGVEALNIIKKVNPNITSDRVRYSAITQAEIKKAFTSTSKIDFNLASAGEARQIIDLIWGAVLTRFVSLAAGRLGDKFLSVGRVQSPTLALVVNREKERQGFVSEPYWELYATLANSGEFVVQHKKGRFSDRKEAEAIKAKLGGTARVTGLRMGTRIDRPPAPFNTTEFLRAASSIGFSTANAMRIAESLYVNGFISYPRTDNMVYPGSLDARGLIQALAEGEFKEYAQRLLAGKLTPTRGKRETTDHPPIHPVSPAKRSELKGDEWKIYELVVRRFFATFAEPAEWETQKVEVDISGEEFWANGTRLVVPGWRWYYSYHLPEDRILPQLREGEVLKVKDVEIAGKETQPPARYGQGNLIKIMEDLGLGTKATRHEIIAKLYARAYVHGNPLQPTKTAIALIDALERYANTITNPEMTSKLEEDMDRIAEGKIREEEVVEESREILDRVFEGLVRNREDIAVSLKNGLYEDRIIGRCPRCASDLVVRKSRKGGRFIGCTSYPKCDFALPLPRTGQIVVTDKECAQHGLYHIKIISRGRRPWEVGCPQCNFNEWRINKEKEASLKGVRPGITAAEN